MTKDCKEKISWLMMQGTRLDNEIAVKLVEKDYAFKTIQSFGAQLNVAISTASRFVKKLGYPSFKHFMYEYNDKTHNEYEIGGVELNALTSKASGKTIADYELECNISRIGSKLTGTIYVLSSQRSKSIANLIIQRLNDAQILSSHFNEKEESLEKWIKQITPQDSIILLTISGHSLRIQKAIDIFQIWKNKPFGLIITATKTMKIPHNFVVVNPNVLNSKYHLNEWVEYNIVQLKVLGIVTIVLNSTFLYRSKEN